MYIPYIANSADGGSLCLTFKAIVFFEYLVLCIHVLKLAVANQNSANIIIFKGFKLRNSDRFIMCLGFAGILIYKLFFSVIPANAC